MRTRPNTRGGTRWSSVVGWAMVTFSLLAVFGSAVFALESSPAFGAARNQAQISQQTIRYQETSPNVRYSGPWRTSAYSAHSSGGHMVYAWHAGTSATVTFSGTSLKWIAIKAPWCGIARVTLDGHRSILVNLYAPWCRYQQTVYSTGTLPAGKHTLKIEWTGKRGTTARRGGGTLVYVDAFVVTAPRSAASTPTTKAATTTIAATTTMAATIRAKIATAGTTAAASTPTTAAPVTTTTKAAPTTTGYIPAAIALSSAAGTTSAPTTTTTAEASVSTTTGAPVTTTKAPGTTAAAPATTTTDAPTTTAVMATTTTTTADPPAAPSTVAGVYNVLSYGAKGDGVADDADAIQAAVNAAKSAGGGVVYLPAGTYRLYAARTVDSDLGANVELFSNITVEGAGPDATVVVADRSWASAFGAFRSSNVTVEDLALTAGASQQDGIKFGVCTDPVVQNVLAHDIYIGIALYSCTDGVVNDCKVHDCSGAGVWIGQGATWTEPSVGGLIENCEGWGGSFTSFRVAGNIYSQIRATGVTLRHCYSHNSGTQNFLFTYSAGLTVDGCTSNTTGSAGLRFAGVTGATVSNSTTPFVSTASNDPNMYATYGSSTGIVVQ